jgi:hypothetical protein
MGMLLVDETIALEVRALELRVSMGDASARMRKYARKRRVGR